MAIGAVVTHTLMLVTITGALVGAVHAMRAWLATRAARAVVAAFGTRVGELAAGKVVVRGVWRGPAMRTAVLGDDRVMCEDARGAWIECEGQRVELAGDVRVVLGTSCKGFHFGRPAGLDTAAVHPIRIMTIADGDRVIVAGTATRTPDSESGYRDSNIRWIVSAGRFSPMLVVAETPVSPPAPLDLFGLIALPAMLGAFAYCALRIATT
jgi:hypothetical protein